MATSYPIRFTSYSGIRVFELTIKGIPVMRRLHDNYVNATQILRAAGLAKPQRTKILDKEVSRGKHDKVQGGYAGFQGTWIPEETAQSLASEYGLEEQIHALLEKPVDQAILDEIQASPPPPKKTIVRASTAEPRKWGTSSASGSDDDERPRRGPGRPRARTSRFSPANSPSRSRNTPRKPTGRTRTGVVTSSPYTIPGPQPNNNPFPSPSHQLEDPVVVKRYCEVCSTAMVPQWRQGPSGKTLCNACEVKWKLKKYIGQRSSGYVIEDEMVESSGSSDSVVLDEANDPHFHLKSQVKNLKKTLKIVERDSNRMSMILSESRMEDRDVDQEYRQVLLAAAGETQRRASLSGTSAYLDKDGSQEDEIIQTFIQAIKRHRSSMETVESRFRF